MKKLRIFVFIGFFMFLFSPPGLYAAEITLGFDDIGEGVLPSDYGDLTWGPEWYVWASQGSSAYPPSSPNNVITMSGMVWDGGNSDIESSLISFGSPVTFLGSYFAASANNRPGDQHLYWEGYLGNTLMYTSDIIHILHYGDPGYQQDVKGFINVVWPNVDSVKFITTSSDYVVVDDFKYETTSVPLPSALLLFGSGLAWLSAAGFRKKNK